MRLGLFGAARYDDTNPEAEKKEYIDHIEEIVQWIGWKPFKVFFLLFIINIRSSIWLIYLFIMFQNLFHYPGQWLTSLVFDQVTYTSDYFQDLYDLSVELIRRGHAYVDHQVSLNSLEGTYS